MEDSPPLHCDASGFESDGAARKKRKPRAKAPKAAVAVAAAPTTRRDAKAAAASAVAPPSVHGAAATETEIEALLRHGSAGGTRTGGAAAEAGGHPAVPVDEVYRRIGQLTRTLNDALRELGYDKELQGTREQLPDARDRLAYIARVTGEAAEKVLNAVDRARGVQQQMTRKAIDLRTRWQAVAAYAANDASRATPAGRALLTETCDFFDGVCGQTDATQAILTDIMMAQDFHDLTGQVIRKVVSLAARMEEQLLKLLLETSPPEQRKRIESERLEGPVVRLEGRDDVVADQAAVDDLLATLGF